MKIKYLYLENFTAFDKAKFEFCDGINVLIGANGTGKTHAMMAMYTVAPLLYFFPNLWTEIFNVTNIKYLIRNYNEKNILHNKENTSIDNKTTSSETIQDISKKILVGKVDDILYEKKSGKVLTKIEINTIYREDAPYFQVYLPTTEMLSIYDHFFATYERQHIPYNRIHYDLALNLNEAILRESHEDYKAIEPIIKNIQEIVTGSKDQEEDLVILENNHFYFNLHGKKLDVNLVADGYRKLGTLYYLLRNGSLTTNSILFWDEPEASLNPILIRKTADIIRQLGLAGIQVFVSTHDYLLAHELSLLAEYPTPPAPEKPNIRFFALYKDEPLAPTQIETGDTLSEIQHDDILNEFAAHNDHEANLFNGV